jgi:hypothetical protein
MTQKYVTDDAIETASRLLGLFAEKYQRQKPSKYEQGVREDYDRCPCWVCPNRTVCRAECARFSEYVAKKK